ncbi:hypothetical protein ARMGADRAFT_746962 [Armillaria gallica]|uniref:Uncharacterized protein n=1 Tax=Armillaria gallica TaxID=47427 RepID=A0A2H3DKK9_ARMGA|nr:hypothetical protein ARMGADRAFT_746962 [Armillaria gallica]
MSSTAHPSQWSISCTLGGWHLAEGPWIAKESRNARFNPRILLLTIVEHRAVRRIDTAASSIRMSSELGGVLDLRYLFRFLTFLRLFHLPRRHQSICSPTQWLDLVRVRRLSFGLRIAKERINPRCVHLLLTLFSSTPLPFTLGFHSLPSSIIASR